MRSVPLLCFLFLLFAAAEATPFTCNATATATCQSLVSYVPQNATTYAAVSSLFQAPLVPLLAANDLPTSTPSATSVPANAAVRVPIPCSCANGNGSSSGVPVYTVKAGDTLDAIARDKFDGFVTYEDIATANRIPNPDNITVGQKVRIPLPCSCDPVGGAAAVHLAYVVLAGSTVEGIAAEFGTTATVLMGINGITDPKKLMADQILDVPLRACSSSISSTSLDHGLLVPNGSYALTANNCISCRCSSQSYQLDCHLNTGLSTSACPADKCNNLSIGNTFTSGCELTTCAYTGFSNATSFRIHANTTTQNACSSPPVSSPNVAYRFGSTRINLVAWLALLHIALLCFSFL